MQDNRNVNPDTGEVFEDSSCSEVVGFRTMWSNPQGVSFCDYSCEEAEIFEEVPPYAIDPKTGKFLNETSVPKIISKGKINIQERIDSYAKECDLYSILEKFAYSGDTALLNARPCSYGDISELPNNLNDYTKFVDYHFEKLKELNPELARLVLDENVNAEDIEARAQEILKDRLDNFNKNNDKDGEK